MAGEFTAGFSAGASAFREGLSIPREIEATRRLFEERAQRLDLQRRMPEIREVTRKATAEFATAHARAESVLNDPNSTPEARKAAWETYAFQTTVGLSKARDTLLQAYGNDENPLVRDHVGGIAGQIDQTFERMTGTAKDFGAISAQQDIQKVGTMERAILDSITRLEEAGMHEEAANYRARLNQTTSMRGQDVQQYLGEIDADVRRDVARIGAEAQIKSAKFGSEAQRGANARAQADWDALGLTRQLETTYGEQALLQILQESGYTDDQIVGIVQSKNPNADPQDIHELLAQERPFSEEVQKRIDSLERQKATLSAENAPKNRIERLDKELLKLRAERDILIDRELEDAELRDSGEARKRWVDEKLKEPGLFNFLEGVRVLATGRPGRVAARRQAREEAETKAGRRRQLGDRQGPVKQPTPGVSPSYPTPEP